MKQLYLAVCILLLTPGFLFAQSISINTDGSSPAASAILDVKSTDKGMLVPRMTTAQRTGIPSPAAGLLVYDTNTQSFWFYNGSVWTNISGGGGTSATFIADTDGNTKVQTEKNPNEDVIRFDLGGTEKMVLQKNANGGARLELPDAGNSTSIGQEAGANNVPVAGVSGENNTFLGFRSGNGNSTGSGNTATGASALLANTSGAYNTANGIHAMHANDTGNENTANGSYALTSNTTGNGNTANGSNALLNNTTAGNNTANGNNALRNNTTGFSNTAIGAGSLFNNTDRSNLVAVGDSALYNNGTGAFLPFEADGNTALGSKALFANTSGYGNTATGSLALQWNTSGRSNTANGYWALRSNTTGLFNTAIGVQALQSNTTGNFNTASGLAALSNNTTGSNNTANGSSALLNNTTGSFNTAIGTNALLSSTTDDYTVAIGYDALYNLNNLSADDISWNTAIGSYALYSETGAGYGANTSVGYKSLYANISGGRNIAMGSETLKSNTTGHENSAIGTYSMTANRTGEGNSALGFEVLSTNFSGNNNTAVGYHALPNVVTGSWNTAIGEYTDVSSFDANSRTMIGTRAFSECDNCVVIGSVAGKNGSAVTAKTGIGTSNPTHTLEVGINDAYKPGTSTWGVSSDRRLKEQIKPFAEGLAAVLRIRPVSYHYTENSGFDKRPEYVGVLAQELQEVAPYMVAESERTLKDGTTGKYLTVDNGAMTYLLINAVKELAAENTALKTQLGMQAAQLQKITAALQTAGIGVEGK